ncbi:unnamed protein product [Rotaria sordida]|uniref:Nudix hydrolase domain-containing protein n=1 Tax=Rotaria sordida TaxID=392033 RepID=A0A814MKF6_9BILA|nr:unnamed protein product [Rotaria sordida]CAF3712797.1 unnamed protein product [Rotaria sordida]
MFQHLGMMIAYGGMPKSGKSSLAKGICKKLQSININCIHLKIGYFMDLVSNALGSDVYQLPEEKQVDELVKQLDHYLNRHYWITIITIESLHSLTFTQALKTLLGSLIQIVYVDTTLDTRMNFSVDTIENLHINDTIKISYSVDKIKTTANFIINNNLDSLNESIDYLFEMLKAKNEKLTYQSKVNIQYLSKINLLSHQFVLSAGAILIRKSTREVCLVHVLDDAGEWVLPKGRKNMNETRSETALRETYEETGYHCSLMPLIM